MDGFYYVISKLRDYMQNDLGIKTFTNGNIDKVGNAKQSIYPYAHIMVNNVSPASPSSSFNISIILMDIVDISKMANDDIFEGNDNELDVLNTVLVYCMRLTENLRRGSLWDDMLRIDSESVSCEPFVDRFEDKVAGWVITFDLNVPNEMTICDGQEKC